MRRGREAGGLVYARVVARLAQTPLTAQVAAPSQQAHATNHPKNGRILLANSKVPKWVCPTCLLCRQKSMRTLRKKKYF
jgi:hypothetical protein